jgi:hypothetical protein
LTERLQANGVFGTPPTSQQTLFDLQSALDAAVEAWEDLTGFDPFLTEATDSVLYFNGDGSATVDLQGGYTSISSVSLNGTARALNTDYRAMPQNARARNKPITYLMFNGRRPFPANDGQEGAVAVHGYRGAYELLPPLAYEGVMAIAVGSLTGQSEFSAFGGIVSWKSGTTEEKYDVNAYARMAASCGERVKSAVAAYRRIKVA